MKSTLTIIILNYNTADWMEKVLTSIEKFHLPKTQVKTEVTMVDNGSSDDSVKKVKKNFPWVNVMETHRNGGFAFGNNVALRQVKTKYAMLLNSDTEFVAESNLDKAIAYLDSHPEVGVVTPRLELPSGQIDLASHRGEPTPWASLTYFSGLAKLFPGTKLVAQYHQTNKNFQTIHEIDACSGAAMIVSTQGMEKVGYLDEQFFMYAEDLDWCKRFRDAGYKVVYFPESTIVHHKYKSGRGTANSSLAKKTNAYFYQTMLQYYDKHYQKRYPRILRWCIQQFIAAKTR
jgi:GT2 family glycosyltransferase